MFISLSSEEKLFISKAMARIDKEIIFFVEKGWRGSNGFRLIGKENIGEELKSIWTFLSQIKVEDIDNQA